MNIEDAKKEIRALMFNMQRFETLHNFTVSELEQKIQKLEKEKTENEEILSGKDAEIEGLIRKIEKSPTARLVDKILHKQQEINEITKNHKETLDWYEDKVADTKERAKEIEIEMKRLKKQKKDLFSRGREVERMEKDLEEQRYQVDFMKNQVKYLENKFKEKLEEAQHEIINLQDNMMFMVREMEDVVADLIKQKGNDVEQDQSLEKRETSEYLIKARIGESSRVANLIGKILENQEKYDRMAEAKDKFNESQDLEICQLRNEIKYAEKELKVLKKKRKNSKLSKKEQRTLKQTKEELTKTREKLESIEKESAKTNDTYNHELDERSREVELLRAEIEQIADELNSKIRQLADEKYEDAKEELEPEDLAEIDEEEVQSSEIAKTSQKSEIARSLKSIAQNPKNGSIREIVKHLKKLVELNDDDIECCMKKVKDLEERNEDYEQKLAEKDAEIKELTEQMNDQPSPKKRKIPGGAVVDTDQLFSKIGRLTMELEAKEAEIKKLQAADKH